MQGFDPKELLKGLAKKKLFLVLVSAVGPYIATILTIVVCAGAAVATVAAIGSAADKIWGGISSVVKLPGSIIDDVKGSDLDEVIKNQLDCRNFKPEDAQPGKNCIEGLLDMGEEQESPIPASKEWLLPVWKKAAKKYDIPWELLAAVNAARTNFGDDNCKTRFGTGFYRMSDKAWKDTKTDAGHATTERPKDCASSAEPAKFDTDGEKDIYDAVDSSFAEAKLLADQGAAGVEEWDYDGGPVGSCVPDRKKEGPIYFMPVYSGGGGDGGGNGTLGGNRRLDIPSADVELAASWRFPISRSGKAMPKSVTIRLLTHAWEAFGAPEAKAKDNANKNYGRIQQESGNKPNQAQLISDVNSASGHPAQGLFQYVPSTFDSWKVDGFNDILNPLDQILATVNAQVNATPVPTDGHGVLIGLQAPAGGPAAATTRTPAAAPPPRGGAGGGGTPANTPSASNIISVPGFPGEEAAASVVPQIVEIAKRFHLKLTDAYDRDGSAGHKSPGHNVTGTAADFAGTDANMDKAVEYLVQQGYEVGYDGRFGSEDWPDHGPSTKTPNAHLHVELGSGGQMETGAGGRDLSKPVKYDGPEATDDVSEAVRSNGDGAAKNSDCYLAIVNEWYEGIINNPPGGDGYNVDAGSVRGKIVQILQGELADHVAEATGSNDGEPVKRYEFPSGQPWCAYFTTWVWRKASVDIDHYGLVDDVGAWGKQHNLWKSRMSQPTPGDAVLYQIGASHIGVVEKVKGRNFTSIEGNYGNKVARRGPQNTTMTGTISGFVAPVRGNAGVSSGDDSNDLDQGDDGNQSTS